MECVTCSVSDIGYTTGNLPKRFSNHKSHIKRKVNSCRLVGHFLEVDHNIDYSKDNYNASLSKHLKVILVDRFDFDEHVTQAEKESFLLQKEGYYQTQLKTLSRYGGLNVLDDPKKFPTEK